MPFGLDYADVDQSAAGEKYYFPIPVNGRTTKLEDECAKQFNHFTEQMKNGSFYTGDLGSLKNSSKQKHITYLEGGVNDGLKRYSDKFRKKIKIGRSIRDHPFILDFFPDELHCVMERKDNKQGQLQLTEYSKGDKAKNILSVEEKKKKIQERLGDVDGNDTNDVADDNEDEEEDEQFEDDEDDDYNAEQYFEDGDDLGGEEEEGGNNETAF